MKSAKVYTLTIITVDFVATNVSSKRLDVLGGGGGGGGSLVIH